MVTKEDLEFIRECDKKKAWLREMVETVRSTLNYDSMKDRVSRAAFDKVKEHSDRLVEQFEQDANDTIQKNEVRKKKILEEVSALPPVEREVIRLRYQQGRSWKWIAYKMHYSDRSLFRIHELALEHLARKM